MEADGASFKATKEEFIAGAGLPVTDGVIGHDGAMYFATGGRRGESNLWRMVYTGSESTAPQPARPAEDEVRDKLADYIRNPENANEELILEHLGSEQRTLRFMARAALERFPDKSWATKIADQKSVWARIHGTMAMARVDGNKHRELALEILGAIAWDELTTHQKINWLRATGLVFIRSGEPNEAERGKVLEKIDSSYPSEERPLNFELARMLCYLQPPGVVGRTLKLMDKSPADEPDPWQDLVERNSRYGKNIGKVMANQPPTSRIHYLYCLRAVKGPWEEGERRRAFNWFREIDSRDGGNSYSAAIAMIRKQIFENGTPEEQKLFAGEAKPPAREQKQLPPVKGPGRAWTVEEIIEVAEGNLEGRDKEDGKSMYEASLCAACHKFGNEGGAQGRNLPILPVASPWRIWRTPSWSRAR